MSDAIERPRTYEEGYRDGFIKGTEQARKTIEELAQGVCNPIIYQVPESEAVKILQEQIQKMKCCENCEYWHKHGFCNCDEECNNYDKWKMKSN